MTEEKYDPRYDRTRSNLTLEQYQHGIKTNYAGLERIEEIDKDPMYFEIIEKLNEVISYREQADQSYKGGQDMQVNPLRGNQECVTAKVQREGSVAGVVGTQEKLLSSLADVISQIEQRFSSILAQPGPTIEPEQDADRGCDLSRVLVRNNRVISYSCSRIIDIIGRCEL